MSAPDFTTLLDFETNFETAAKTFLATDTGLPTSSLYANLDQDYFTNPRLEIEFVVGEAADPPTPQTVNSSRVEYMQYTGTLNIHVVSDASVDGTHVMHRQLRAKIRRSLLLNAQNFTTPTVLPYYEVNYLRPSGTTFGLEKELATTTLSFEVKFAIKTDAFPSALLRLRTKNEAYAVTAISHPVFDVVSLPKTLTTSYVQYGKIGTLQGTQTLQITTPLSNNDTLDIESFTISNCSNLQLVGPATSGVFTVDVDTDALFNEDNINIAIAYAN